MATLQVRDFPDELHEKLVKVAKDEHRSLAQQVLVILTQALEQVESNKNRRKSVLDEIFRHRANNASKKAPAPVKILREDRDR